MVKNFFIAVFLVFISVDLSAQLVVNELSQGSGSDEYAELVVVGTKTCTDSTANLQGWILDDNCGFYGSDGIAGGHYRFSTAAQWAAIPYGTIIVIYNGSAVFPGLVADETDANNDNVYILPSTSSYFETNTTTPGSGTTITTYATTGYTAGGGDWTKMGMRNGGDVFQTVSPSVLNAAYHAVGWGNMSGMDIAFAGSASSLVFQNENVTDNDPFLQSNWTSQDQINGTPGLGNSAANTAWINAMAAPLTPINTTINDTICDGDSKFFNDQNLTVLGTYLDTLTSSAGCDSIVTLELVVEVCADCEMDLGNDLLICGPVNMTLDAGVFDEYLWNDGSTNQTLNVISSGEYYCEGRTFNATNLIVNPGFESGDVNFTTDYVVGTGGSWGQLSNSGTYAITTSPSFVHNNFVSCGDHTSNSGNMLVANGSTAANTNAWCQTITVTPNTDYVFSAWTINADGVSTQASQMAELRLTVDGLPIGSTYSPSVTNCNWTQFSSTLSSAASTSMTICIENTNLTPGGAGADFAIDDIFFGEVCIANDTINILNETNYVDSAVVNSCYGESALIFGNNETQEGLYLDTIKTLAGCDSLYLKRFLQVEDSLYTNVNTTICFGDSVFLENAWQKTSNTYSEVFQSSLLCDSLVTTVLRVSFAPTTVVTYACTELLSEEGVFLDTIPNYFGCDSVYNELHKIREIADEYTLDTLMICEGESVEIFGNMETEAGSYSSTLTSVLGCDSLIRNQVLVINAYPSINNGNDVTIVSGDSAILDASEGSSYSWNTGEETASILVSPQSTTNYSVVVDANGCADSVTVFVINEDVEILIPNAFTPNADNLNDVFKIVNEDEFENISIRIYNRWGEMVFSSENNGLAWDGIFEGKEQEGENYTYYVEATARTTQKEVKVGGTVTLLR